MGAVRGAGAGMRRGQHSDEPSKYEKEAEERAEERKGRGSVFRHVPTSHVFYPLSPNSVEEQREKMRQSQSCKNASFRNASFSTNDNGERQTEPYYNIRNANRSDDGESQNELRKAEYGFCKMPIVTNFCTCQRFSRGTIQAVILVPRPAPILATRTSPRFISLRILTEY